MGLHRESGRVLMVVEAKGPPEVAAPARYATARSRPRRRKARAKPPAPAPSRPIPRFSWHPWECSFKAIWNCLRFGPPWEFDLRRLAAFFGIIWPCAPSGASSMPA
jgi:hypothetical protein